MKKFLLLVAATAVLVVGSNVAEAHDGFYVPQPNAALYRPSYGGVGFMYGNYGYGPSVTFGYGVQPRVTHYYGAVPNRRCGCAPGHCHHYSGHGVHHGNFHGHGHRR